MEMSLHVTPSNYGANSRDKTKGGSSRSAVDTQGQLKHIASCLQQGNNVWIAVGGERELHPAVRKVHTGGIRVALLAAAAAVEECDRVLVVPTHLAFECHCQGSSEVVVELGEPIDVREMALEEDCTPANRELVRRLRDLLAVRLFAMTNLIPEAAATTAGVPVASKYSSKKTKGAGEKKAAIEEWRVVRMLDSIVCLAHPQSNGGQQPQQQHDLLTWQLRVAKLRKCCQVYTAATAHKLTRGPVDGGNGDKSKGRDTTLARQQLQAFELFEAEFKQFEPLYEAVTGEPLFQGPRGCSWDMTASLKAMPHVRTHASGVRAKCGLDMLRNFSHGAIEWRASCTARAQDEPALEVAFCRLKGAAATAARLLHHQEAI
jgi:hypothetical protein